MLFAQGLRLGTGACSRQGGRRADDQRLSRHQATRSTRRWGDFAVAYADQAERDHAALKAAVRTGKIEVLTEE